MSRRIDWVLSEEDRVLWHQVARTAKPLRPAAPQPDRPRAADRLDGAPPALSVQRPARPSPPAPGGRMERKTVDKLAKGRLPLDARLDLHGMRQDEAHSLLLSFLSRAHARGARHVLVITGKGPGGDGVLKRSVPEWLRTAPFRLYVSGLDHAARGHGGAGALYVRLRRRGP